MPYETFWVARELSGALWIFDAEPYWGGTMWHKPTVTTWTRKLVPRRYPSLKAGWKMRIRAQHAGPPVKGEV